MSILKIKLIFTAILLTVSPSAIAITRTIECESDRYRGLHVTILLRGGLAQLLFCESNCSSRDGNSPDFYQSAVLYKTEEETGTLYYVPTSGKGPLMEEMAISFGAQTQDVVFVKIDSDTSWACQ